MPTRDFFRFCTTLKPLELKAIGKMSHVRHLQEGETVYAPGDPADALYIVTRGIVEVVQTGKNQESAETYLSRGEIFGDVEALTETPRKHMIRAREPGSLQCFPQKNFAELVLRVPSFFQYLSEQLAFRLSQAKDLTVAEGDSLELSGSLANFDLVTIYQTIVNSSQTGELRLSSKNGQLISACSFENGRLCRVQFEHLTGEEAFMQLFLSDSLTGSFSFSSGDQPVSAYVWSGGLTRNPEEMLIAALQGRDELNAMKNRMSDGAATLRRLPSNLTVQSSVSPELQEVGEQVWKNVGSGPITLSGLFRQCSFCELKIYLAVDELVESQHLDLTPVLSGKKVA